MKPLKTNQRVMTWLCICRPNEKTSELKKFVYGVYAVLIFLGCFNLLIASIAFFLKYVSISLEQSLYALFQIAGIFGTVYMVLAAFALRHQIIAIFDKLSNIYDAYENDERFQLVVQANNQSEWLWKMYFIFVLGGFVVNSLLLVLISVLYCWFTHGYLDATSFYRTYKTVFPWDQETLLGYSFATFFDLFGADCYFTCNGSLMLLFISMCLHYEAFYEMFQQDVSKLDHPPNPENTDHRDILCKLIRFHVITKEWFLQSAETYRNFVLVQLIGSVIFLAAVVFQLDLQSKHPSVNLVLLLFGVFVSGTNLFVYCYFGKCATESFLKMGDCLYEANWRELSIDMQKHIIIMIENAQRPLYYHGFGVAVLNLETFCKLLRAVATFYMAFKTFNE